MTEQPEIIKSITDEAGKKPVIISVVASENTYNSCYSFLESEYTVFSFLTGPQAVRSEHFFWSHILMLDEESPVLSDRTLAKYLFDRNRDAKLFTSWKTDRGIDAEMLPWLYYIYKRPFDKNEIRIKINEASATLVNHEKRKEPRVNISVPVDLYFKKEFWNTATVNLSLNGMQTTWSRPQLGEEMKEMFKTGTSPVTYARLKLTDINGKRNDLEMNVSMKYFSEPSRTGSSLLGFQFKNTDLGAASRLYDALTA